MYVTTKLRNKILLHPLILGFVSLFLISGTVLAVQNESKSYSDQTSSNPKINSGADKTSENGNIYSNKPSENIFPNISDSVTNQSVITDNATVSRGTENVTKTSITIDTSVSTNADDTSDNSADIKINGQSVDVPENGRFRKDIRSDDGRTRIRGHIDSENTSINISTNDSTELEAN